MPVDFISCPTCLARIEGVIGVMDGLPDVSVDFEAGHTTVEYPTPVPDPFPSETTREENYMPHRFAFIYFLKDTPNKIREVVPYHVDYWKDTGLEGYLGGLFADRTGGLIAFEAAGPAEATALVEQDPFVILGLIEARWIKEWTPELQPLV